MNLLLDELGNLEINDHLQALLENRPFERCIWIENETPDDLDAYLGTFTHNGKCRLFTGYMTRADRSLFAPFRRLLSDTQELWSSWAWMENYKHEINTLLPGTYGPEYNVNRVGNGWSEVRLNGEIAWGFRLLHFFAQFVQELAKGQPLVLVLHDFQYADRLSIQLVFHLLHNLQAKNLLILLGRRAYDIDGETSPLDDGSAIDKLFARFLQKVQPLYLSGDQLTPASYIGFAPSQLPEPLAARDNVYAAVNALRSGDFDLHRVLGTLHDALVWYNFDNTLWLAGELLNRLDLVEAALVQQVQFEVWRHIGIAHAFMDQYAESLHAFQQMYDSAQTVTEQAKAIHFLALLYGKRMKKWELSKKIVDQGLELTKDSTDFDVVYERCWLYNYLAYVNYSVDKDFETAKKHILLAYRDMKPFQGYNRSGNVMDEIADPKLPIRLLGNVESNIAYLHYYSGQYRLALTTWQGAVPKFTKQAPIYFLKEYYHFEGNIHRKMGNYRQAISGYEKAFQICLDHSDSFHAELTAQSLGNAHFLDGNYAEAARWYEQALELKRVVGDLRVAKNYSSLLLSHLFAGNETAAEQLFAKCQKELNPRFATLYQTGQLLTANHHEFLEAGPPILVQAYPQMHI